MRLLSTLPPWILIVSSLVVISLGHRTMPGPQSRQLWQLQPHSSQLRKPNRSSSPSQPLSEALKRGLLWVYLHGRPQAFSSNHYLELGHCRTDIWGTSGLQPTEVLMAERWHLLGGPSSQVHGKRKGWKILGSRHRCLPHSSGARLYWKCWMEGDSDPRGGL